MLVDLGFRECATHVNKLECPTASGYSYEAGSVTSCFSG